LDAGITVLHPLRPFARDALLIAVRIEESVAIRHAISVDVLAMTTHHDFIGILFGKAAFFASDLAAGGGAEVICRSKSEEK